MICLDTNFLIRAMISHSVEAGRVSYWLKQDQPIALPSVAWYEFLCGPVNQEEVGLAKAILTGGILPFLAPQAKEAARLYNAANRARRIKVDAMIAATATLADASLATSNTADFQCFVPYGLKLWKQR